MTTFQQCSFSVEEIAAIKRAVVGETEFVDRVSFALALRLISGNDAHSVLLEIGCLESGTPTSTKPAAQFKRTPLHPFWHKHFFAPRHFSKNIGERWNVARGEGNRALSEMLNEVALRFGHDPRLWPSAVGHRFVLGGIDERSEAGRITGDWIVFGKYQNKNYYCDLATHEEGKSCESSERLIAKLRAGCEWEFPFLFKS